MLDLLVATSSKSKPRVNECEKIDQEARLGGRVARVFFPHCMRRFSPCFQRTGCSTPDPPHLSVSTRSFSLLTHVGSPGISTLHSAEPTFSTTEPYRCHIAFQKAAGKRNPRLLGCNPLQHDHTSAPRSEAVYTSDASTQHISGSGISHEVPGTGTLLRTLGRRTCVNRTELQNTASSVLLALLLGERSGSPRTNRLTNSKIIGRSHMSVRLLGTTICTTRTWYVCSVRKRIIVPVRPVCVCSSHETTKTPLLSPINIQHTHSCSVWAA